MNIRIFKFEEDPFCKDAQGFSKFYHEDLLLKKILQTKPQVKKINFTYYDLYSTVSNNRDDKESVNT